MTDLAELEEISFPRNHRRKARRIHPITNVTLDYKDPKQVFGIDSWIRMGVFSKYPGRLNTFDYVKHAVTSFYESYPSVISLHEVNIIRAITQLKKLGTVDGIFSGYFDGGNPNTLCLYLEIQGQKIFACADNINYLSTKGYKGYTSDDLISGTLPLGQLVFFFLGDNSSIYSIANSISETTLEWEEESYIDMIVATEQGLGLRSITLDPVQDFDLNIHYGESFQSYNDKLIERLDKKDKVL